MHYIEALCIAGIKLEAHAMLRRLLRIGPEVEEGNELVLPVIRHDNILRIAESHLARIGQEHIACGAL